MELNKYESIKNLKPARFDWKCRMRLQAMWKGVNSETKEFWDINMIFIDDSNNRIHAFASSKYCQDVINEIKEGNIYILSNFKVKDYVGDETYRPVRNHKHIFFTKHTTIEKGTEIGMKIETHAFDLFYLGDMKKMAQDNRFLVDVVGKVQNVRGNLKSTKNDIEKILTKFDLFDGRNTVSVTLFDDFGAEFEEDLQNCKQSDIYIIICAAKIGIYEELPNLTTYPATRIYINPPHYSIRELKERIDSIKSKQVSSPPAQEIIFPTLTIKDINLLPSDYAEGKVKCQVQVTKVEEQSSWFYAVCTNCPKQLLQEDGIYKCKDCNRIIPYPDKRFRICTLCSDNTGSIAIIFLDEEVSRIVDKTVFDFEVEAIKNGTEGKFPPLLKQFEKKQYTITLNITENNLKKGSRVYEAYEIFDKVESGASFDPSTQTDTEMLTAATVNLKDDNTSSTGVSSTKTRPRIDIEPVAFDPQGEIPAKLLRNKDKSSN